MAEPTMYPNFYFVLDLTTKSWTKGILCQRKQIRSVEGIQVKRCPPEEKMHLQETAHTCGNNEHSITPQLMVTDELVNVSLPEFPEIKTTQSSHFYVLECLANFDILTLISLPIFRKTKAGLCIKGVTHLYYDHGDTDSPAGHSLTSKALLLSSFCHHLGFLGNSSVEKYSFSPLQTLRHKQHTSRMAR